MVSQGARQKRGTHKISSAVVSSVMLIVTKNRMMRAPQMRHNHGEREMRDETMRAEKVTMACRAPQASVRGVSRVRERGMKAHPGDGDHDPVRVLGLCPESDDAEEVVRELPRADDLRDGVRVREWVYGRDKCDARTVMGGGTRGYGGDPPRTWSRMCEHSSKLPTIQEAYRAHGFSPLRLRHSRNTHVNMAPATGQVDAISPRTAASDIMKRPDKGHAMAYIEPPPASRAVRTPRVVPIEGSSVNVSQDEARRGGQGVRTWQTADVADGDAETRKEVVVAAQLLVKPKLGEALLLVDAALAAHGARLPAAERPREVVGRVSAVRVGRRGRIARVMREVRGRREGQDRGSRAWGREEDGVLVCGGGDGELVLGVVVVDRVGRRRTEARSWCVGWRCRGDGRSGRERQRRNLGFRREGEEGSRGESASLRRRGASWIGPLQDGL